MVDAPQSLQNGEMGRAMFSAGGRTEPPCKLHSTQLLCPPLLHVAETACSYFHEEEVYYFSKRDVYYSREKVRRKNF
jgi:hypothetical protein